MSNAPGLTPDINAAALNPHSTALDLSALTHPVTCLWSDELRKCLSGRSGDVMVDYPFKRGWPRLDQDSRDPELARDVKNRLNGLVQGLLDNASSAKIGTGPLEYILTELITNATQYGSMSDEVKLVGVLRLRWEVSEDRHDPSIEIKLSNPTQGVFDVGKYAGITHEDWFANLEKDAESGSDSSNGHVGVITVAALVKKGSEVRYEWELLDGGRVACLVRPYCSTDEDRPADDSSLISPLRITAEKFDPHGNRQPYSYQELKGDLANPESLLATTLTVSCVIGRANPDSPADNTAA